MNNLLVDKSKDDSWKKRVTILGISLATIILLVRFLTDVYIKNSCDISNYTTLLTVFVFLSLLAYIKKFDDYDRAIFIAFLFSIFLIYVRGNLTGRLHSPLMAWYPILPIVSSFLLSRKNTYVIFGVSLFFLFLTANFNLPSYFNLPIEELGSISRLTTYVAIVVISTIFCVSHEKKRDEMIEQIESQRMSILSSSRNTELGEIASGIAHEISNPLTVIKVKAKKIQGISLENEEMSDSINKILLMSDRINKIVKSMKNLSKAQSAQGKTPTDSFGYILDDTLTLCETKMTYSKIDLKVSYSIKEIEQLEVPIQLGHIILNVLNNAYEAVLKVQNKWIRIEINKNKNILIIKISDSGIMIEKSEISKIFNPFYSNESSRIGLGLSISKSNLLNLGGEISLDTKAKNTSFIISVPISTKI